LPGGSVSHWEIAPFHGARRRWAQDVVELMSYFRPAQPDQAVRAIPGAGLDVPVWILGSSLYGAQLAAMLGLPYAFASHFAPAGMEQAITIYRARFQPSEQLATPQVMLGLNICAAETDADARRLFTSHQLRTINNRTGNRGPLAPPIDDFESRLSARERVILQHALSCSVVGSPDTVKRGRTAFIERTGADEIMVAAHIYDHAARVRSYEIAAGVHGLK
jgi:luciferase family oxidoreductase group 1